MPYTPGNFDSAHLYLQWGGNLPGGEQWTCGLRMANVNTGVPITDAIDLVDNAAGAVLTYFTRDKTHINSNATLTFVKLNAIGTDGKYQSDTTAEQAMPNNHAGGFSSPLYPNQVCLAVSLTTGFSRGAAHRGRFYNPLPDAGLTTTGILDQAIADDVANSSMTFITDLNSISSHYRVAVFSRKQGAATHRLVTGVQVGRAIDTQRRRRNKLVENYRANA